MSTTDTDTDSGTDSPRSTYAISYEAKVTLPEDVSISQALLDELPETLGAGFGAARDVGEIK